MAFRHARTTNSMLLEQRGDEQPRATAEARRPNGKDSHRASLNFAYAGLRLKS
jgi:hypothetical protein